MELSCLALESIDFDEDTSLEGESRASNHRPRAASTMFFLPPAKSKKVVRFDPHPTIQCFEPLDSFDSAENVRLYGRYSIEFSRMLLKLSETKSRIKLWAESNNRSTNRRGTLTRVNIVPSEQENSIEASLSAPTFLSKLSALRLNRRVADDESSRTISSGATHDAIQIPAASMASYDTENSILASLNDNSDAAAGFTADGRRVLDSVVSDGEMTTASTSAAINSYLHRGYTRPHSSEDALDDSSSKSSQPPSKRRKTSPAIMFFIFVIVIAMAIVTGMVRGKRTRRGSQQINQVASDQQQQIPNQLNQTSRSPVPLSPPTSSPYQLLGTPAPRMGGVTQPDNANHAVGVPSTNYTTRASKAPNAYPMACFKTSEELTSAVDSFMAFIVRGIIPGLDLNLWCLSPEITSLASVFSALRNPDMAFFNEDIRDWDVSHVTDMTDTFRGSAFNCPLDRWNVSSVRNMSGTFLGARSFNQNIGAWQTDNVEDMSFMFADAVSFQQDLGNWKVEKVTSFLGMFQGASSFGCDLCAWASQVGEYAESRFMFVGTSCQSVESPVWASMGPYCASCVIPKELGFFS